MNKKELSVVILVLVFTIVAGGLTVATSGNKTPDKHESSTPKDAVDLTNQTEVKLTITAYAYSKRDIKVKKGTTVTWTNQDSMEHNAMLEHEDSGHAHDAPPVSEVRPDVFAGPLLKKGESYSFTFDEIGTYPYHCAPHPSMRGSITVVE